METALVLNCCSHLAKQCLIWNKCYAIDSDRVGARSRREKPSWEPSPGLEKSTVKLLGRSASQGKHPWLQDLPVLSLRWRKGKVSVLFFWRGEGFISTSLPCSSALAKNFLGEFMVCYFRRLVSLLLGMLNKTNPFLTSFLSPFEGGDFFMAHASWQNPLQQYLQSCLQILGISSACFTFSWWYYLGNYMGESRFKKKKANPPQERIHAPRSKWTSRFFKAWRHAHQNHWHK